MSLKAQTHFNTIRNVWVFSTHWLPPPQRLACLRAHTALQMRLRHCPPISVLNTPYAFTPPPLPSLCAWSALLTLLTILMLAQCPPDTTYPYTCVVPSRHASDTAYHPYACVEPSRHAFDTTYHPYACCPPDMPMTQLTILTLVECPPDMAYHLYARGVPSGHAPNTTYDPYACVVPSRHCLPSLRLQSALPTCSRHHL
ncbi:hypothetical protein O181_074875 [Austropuccinia psidii MF-1]|uniref:Uncharacterized protein n=1 Tax=Austropuccinia psidii MF-1 TaxID=1389203 RepID=A0A9Q3FDA1_9BASI|nr:hypothetical protein [Austropuccinia psidii MF-1]